MKKLISILLFLFIIFSCTNESLETESILSSENFKKKTSLPDLAFLITKENFRNGSIEKKIDSITKNWEGKLKILIEDKGLIKINKQGLYLKKYTKMVNNSIINDFLDKPLTETSYEPIYNLEDKKNSNIFNVEQPYLDHKYENILKDKNEFIKKGIKKHLEDLGIRSPSELNFVVLEWEYKSKVFYTNAIFTKNQLIYDEILVNLREIDYKIQRKSKLKQNLSFSKINFSCDSLFANERISFSDRVEHTRTGPLGFAWGDVSITISGELEITNCTKYIQTYGSKKLGNSSYGYSHDEKVGVAFLPAGIGTNGYCNYEIAVALAGYTFGSVSLEWDGFSMSISSGSPSGSTFSSKQNYVIPSMLE